MVCSAVKYQDPMVAKVAQSRLSLTNRRGPCPRLVHRRSMKNCEVMFPDLVRQFLYLLVAHVSSGTAQLSDLTRVEA